MGQCLSFRQRFTGASVLVISLSAMSAQATVTFDWATVGNAGNAADPLTGYGAVAYEYRIATTEVTNAQYVEFLNAKAATDNYGLYNTSMATNFSGITRSGTLGNYTYATTAERSNNPVTFVSWYDAVRFTNWLHNGQEGGDTETGAYTLLGGTPTPINGPIISRNTGAQYYLPSGDEWYKSAFHDVTAGTAGNYFLYATGSDSTPISDNPTDNAAAVNYYNDDGLVNGFNDGYAVALKGATVHPPLTNPFTDVSAYTEAVGPYGTFDQNGNVNEWNEALFEVVTGRYELGAFGGAYNNVLKQLQSMAVQVFHIYAHAEDPGIGFRVASPVPVPLMHGDLDFDGDVDDADFGIAFAAFTGPDSGPSSNMNADLDQDGDVDDADFGLAFAAFTGPGSATAIPEPSSMLLLSLAAPLFLRRRR